MKLPSGAEEPLPFNRDLHGQINYKKERSYFAYNQVIYRGGQVHLAGRLHLDTHNTVMYGDYGLDGVLEMARVTSLSIQTAARVSPGHGYLFHADRQSIGKRNSCAAYKRTGGRPKNDSRNSSSDDRGGMVYDPIIGLHEDVAEIDFFSMYPSIMVHFDISPETE
ncbi:MAG: hypothetical protein M0C28_34800 [Candidatus Moduliflexus flocculans]|nr:hypothetical protein [Candidatus Moduliflexus flocculans]